MFNTDPQQAAAGAQVRGIQSGLTQATPLIQQGLGQATQDYYGGIAPFMQNWQQANLGTTQFGNALGLNGPQGNAAAVAGFQNNPGYKFGLQQGEDAIAAQAAKGGMGASGNALLAADQFGVNYANQNWNNYINQLQPYLNYGTQGAAGIQSGFNPLAQQTGQTYNTLGNMTYGADTSIGNAYANADLAQAGVNSNILNTLGQGAKAIVSMLPK